MSAPLPAQSADSPYSSQTEGDIATFGKTISNKFDCFALNFRYF